MAKPMITLLKYGMLALVFGLALFFSADFYKDLNAGKILEGIQSVSPVVLLLLFFVNFLLLFIIARRWQVLLTEHLPLTMLAMNRLSGFAFSYITPGTQIGGEALQIGLLVQNNALSSKEALKHVVTERGVDFVGNIVMVLLLSFFYGAALFRHLNIALDTVFFISVGIGCFFITLLSYFYWRKKTSAVTITREDALRLSHIAILTFIIWMLFIAELWLIFAAVGVMLDLHDLLTMLLAIRLAFWLPLPVPAAAGILEAAILLAAELCAIDTNLALSAVLLMRFRDVSLVCVGLIYATITGIFPPLSDRLQMLRGKWLVKEGAHD
ncbi:MAG: lysylphosphatidylglycerol synthase transmembrane domain-containing protein [Calditrichia bacterium]